MSTPRTAVRVRAGALALALCATTALAAPAAAQRPGRRPRRGHTAVGRRLSRPERPALGRGAPPGCPPARRRRSHGPRRQDLRPDRHRGRRLRQIHGRPHCRPVPHPDARRRDCPGRAHGRGPVGRRRPPGPGRRRRPGRPALQRRPPALLDPPAVDAAPAPVGAARLPHSDAERAGTDHDVRPRLPRHVRHRLPRGKGVKRVIMSGFDPYTLDGGTTGRAPGTVGNNIRHGNPSGATALALDGTTYRTKDGRIAHIEAYTLPVNYPRVPARATWRTPSGRSCARAASGSTRRSP